ncbi:MAG: hypothetical protein ABEI99_00440 [Halobaculum sp.]
MAREIRVTIDDDEVFERLRARKRELDLSWEEVLHRGLRGGPGDSPDEDIGDRLERQITRRVEESLGRAFGLDESASRHSGGGASSDSGGSSGGSRDPTPPGSPSPDSPSPPGGVDPAGRGTPGGPQGGPAAGGPRQPSGGLDAEVETLANAEDAVLRFPFLDDDPGNTVPLRVNLETSADGLDVEVVTIRSGKAVAERNAFDRGARRQIAEALATGETAILELDAGVEEYHVVPVLSWSDDDGTPTVTEVSISEVSFDA